MHVIRAEEELLAASLRSARSKVAPENGQRVNVPASSRTATRRTRPARRRSARRTRCGRHVRSAARRIWRCRAARRRGRCYERLGARCSNGALVNIWFGDERCVPRRGRGARTPRLASEKLGRAERGPRARGSRRARPHRTPPADERELDDAGMPILALLGLGPDGHTASLFPRQAALDAPRPRHVGEHDSPKPPPGRDLAVARRRSNAAACWCCSYRPREGGGARARRSERRTLRPRLRCWHGSG